MPRSMWSGSLTFGLVNIPVRMFPAVKAKELRFHLLHKKDNTRVQQKLVCPAEHGKEVPREDTVKGYELSPDRMVVVDPEELKALEPKADRSISILDFVPLSEIDPVYFNQPYFLLPDERAAKAYRLFYEALAHSGKTAIGSFVMRNRQYLAAIRAVDGVLVLETMYFADEIVTRRELEGVPDGVKVSARELEMAERLVDSLTTSFKASKYHDTYREKVRKLLSRKAEGKHVVAQAPKVSGRPEVIDLMSALKASLDDTKRRKKKVA